MLLDSSMQSHPLNQITAQFYTKIFFFVGHLINGLLKMLAVFPFLNNSPIIFVRVCIACNDLICNIGMGLTL